jgi:prepilin-type N-terminal cleavage/methylation domain-containing protein
VLTRVRRAHDRRGDDRGVTLLELVIAISVTGVVLVAVASGLSLMIKSYTRVQDRSLAQDRGRVVLDGLDRDLRWASSVNLPVRIGDTWYLEFQGNARTGTTQECSQWRLDTAADTLQTRRWTVGTATAPAWRTVATRVTNDPSTRRPFTVLPASQTVRHQQVDLQLELTLPRGSGVSVARLTARNSSSASPSNSDVDGDTVSDDEVCTSFGRS